jgi:hypothetical protein
MKHQYSININSLEPQLLGCLLLLVLLIYCEVHPKLFFLNLKLWNVNISLHFQKTMIDVLFFWPTYYITYSSKSGKIYKIKCVELLGTSLKHIENLI